MSPTFETVAQPCGYLADGVSAKTRCQNDATHRNAEVARCHLHGGHHDYSEKWDGQQWSQIQ